MLEALPEQIVAFDEPMSRHTSFRIGGPADILVQPRSISEVQKAVALSYRERIPLTVIGNGTNLLVRDAGIRGLVLKVGESFSHVALEDDLVSAQGGAELRVIAQLAAEKGLSGLEFAVGIPGTIGGAVTMNAGAFGGEMRDVVSACSVMDLAGQVAEAPAESLRFSYRASTLQNHMRIVVNVHMRLKPAPGDFIRAKMETFTKQRESTQPFVSASAGSVFKRPVGNFVGRLVEELGLKGFRIGDAQVSEKHAGFIVNCGYATSKDVLAVVAHIEQAVLNKYHIALEREVRVIGDDE